MSRSLWKGPYIKLALLKKVMKSKKKVFKTYSRGSVISPSFVGVRLRLHNGKSFLPLTVSEGHVGHKLGEFIATRAKFEHKKKKKKKSK